MKALRKQDRTPLEYRLLETNEMRVLRKTSGRKLNGVRNEDIRRICKAEGINAWVKRREGEWNDDNNIITE
jgi:hypothetical protein